MKKNFYGWVNLAAGCLILLAVLGLANATMSLYIKPIAEDLGEARAAVSLMVSLLAMTSVMFNFVYGRFVKRIGFKRMIVVGLLTAALGVFLNSFARQSWMLYGPSVLIGLGLTFAGTIPMSAVVQNWFHEKRGLAIGITMASSGIGGMIFNPIMGRLIAAFGWRMSFRIEAVIMVIVGLIGCTLLVPHPDMKGQKPLGYKENDLEDASRGTQGLTLAEARKTRSFKFLALAVFLMGLAIQPIFVSIPAYFSDIGYPATYGASMMSLVFMFNTVAKIGSGMVNDRLGHRVVVAIDYSAFGLAMAFLLLTEWHVAFALVFGLALSMLAVPVPLLVTHLFGQKDYASIYGFAMGLLLVGASSSTILVNFVFDSTGSYVPYFIAALVFAGISALAVIGAERNKVNWESAIVIQTAQADEVEAMKQV